MSSDFNNGNGKNPRFLAWFAVAASVASCFFTGGQYYYKVSALETQINKLEADLVRKDVLEGKLDKLDYQLDEMRDSLGRNEARMAEVLRYIK